MNRPDDDVAKVRRAGTRDRDDRVYARQRYRDQRRREALERTTYDPGPPTDDDWVVPDRGDGLRRVGPPTAIGSSLQDLIDRRGWTERLRGADVWSRWGEIVGEDLAAKCEPVRLAGGTLTIRAESHLWATQLRYLVTRLQVNVDDHLGAGSVREVRIVVGVLEGREAPEVED
jgi:hypothetical protein